MTIRCPRRQIVAAIFIVTLVLQVTMTACRDQPETPPEASPAARNIRPTITASSVTVTPWPTATVEALPTSTPTAAPTATVLPVTSVYAPAYLERNVLAAFEQLQSLEASWRWEYTNSASRADLLLEPGDEGIPSGFRTVALTVPFTHPLEEIAFSEVEALVGAVDEVVVSLDWALMPANRKALRVDGLLPSDRDYPLRQSWSLVATAGHELAADQLAPALQKTLSEDPLVHLTAVGDLMLDRAIGYALVNGDSSFPFGAVETALQLGDFTIGNLESALGNSGSPASKSYTFQAPPEAADALSAAGFDLVSLANNHALDYGPEALQQALELLEQRGIAAVGAGQNAALARKPFVFEHEELAIAFLGYVDVPVEVTGFDTRSWMATPGSAGLAWANPEDIAQDVAAALQESDLVVVLLHSGYENVEAPSPAQTAAARAAIEAGAALVVGHHAHVLQGIETGDDSAIAYGLGNFAFEMQGDPYTAILNVWLDIDGVRQLELVPAIIEPAGRPRLATELEASQIRAHVYYLSQFLNQTP